MDAPDGAARHPLVDRCLPAVNECVTTAGELSSALESTVREAAVLSSSYAALLKNTLTGASQGTSCAGDEGSSLAASAETSDENEASDSGAEELRMPTLLFPSHHRPAVRTRQPAPVLS
eukprot:TRINITY_DN14727_c0_g1_i2.p2 TRINITY_DN14727_c0_g1~~TRINITY_DN14727_c0_g1_i2.p2  ORF type:complete len:137 (+),score=28.16 TRINITY_DN14727_c0_g1_i2:55-411(+)